MTPPLNEKLKSVKWGKYKLGDIFDILSYKKRFDANKVTIYETGQYPYIVRMGTNNGQKGFLNEDIQFINDGNTISFGQDTATVFYQEKPYFTGDKIKILRPKYNEFCKKNALFFVVAMNLAFKSFSWGSSSFNMKIIKNVELTLPLTSDGQINFSFMESLIAELEAERIAELSAYLKVSGLDDYQLSKDEEKALAKYKTYVWGSFNLKALYGESTRGKRLKSEDRIPGPLPFVTAGEAEEGVSAFIGNKVDIFEKNTITIDMFGSAKYRHYQYGGDDHVAIVHTEKIPMEAALFVTSAIHKVAHTGKFNYGHNFYAKDADALDIMLPIKEGKPDYQTMELLISAIQKLVLKDVVQYADIKINSTKQVIAEE